MRGENSTEVMAFGKRCLNSGGMRKPCLAGSPTEPRPKEPALARNTYTHYTERVCCIASIFCVNTRILRKRKQRAKKNAFDMSKNWDIIRTLGVKVRRLCKYAIHAAHPAGKARPRRRECTIAQKKPLRVGGAYIRNS